MYTRHLVLIAGSMSLSAKTQKKLFSVNEFASLSKSVQLSIVAKCLCRGHVWVVGHMHVDYHTGWCLHPLITEYLCVDETETRCEFYCMWNLRFREVLSAQKGICILFSFCTFKCPVCMNLGVLGLCYDFISKYRCQVHPCFLSLWRQIKLKHLKQKSCPFGVVMSFGASH